MTDIRKHKDHSCFIFYFFQPYFNHLNTDRKIEKRECNTFKKRPSTTNVWYKVTVSATYIDSLSNLDFKAEVYLIALSEVDCWAVIHWKQEGSIPLGYFCPNVSSEWIHPLLSRNKLTWGGANVVVGIFLSTSVVCLHLCDWVESWMW